MDIPSLEKASRGHLPVVADEQAHYGAVGTELPDSYVCGRLMGIDAIRSEHTYIPFCIFRKELLYIKLDLM